MTMLSSLTCRRARQNATSLLGTYHTLPCQQMDRLQSLAHPHFRVTGDSKAVLRLANDVRAYVPVWCLQSICGAVMSHEHCPPPFPFTKTRESEHVESAGIIILL